MIAVSNAEIIRCNLFYFLGNQPKLEQLFEEKYEALFYSFLII